MTEKWNFKTLQDGEGDGMKSREGIPVTHYDERLKEEVVAFAKATSQKEARDRSGWFLSDLIHSSIEYTTGSICRSLRSECGWGKLMALTIVALPTTNHQWRKCVSRVASRSAFNQKYMFLIYLLLCSEIRTSWLTRLMTSTLKLDLASTDITKYLYARRL